MTEFLMTKNLPYRHFLSTFWINHKRLTVVAYFSVKCRQQINNTKHKLQIKRAIIASMH